MDRRLFLSGGATAAVLAACGGGGSSGGGEATGEAAPMGTAPDALPQAAPVARVVVVGGGMAGVTVAKYLRRWSNGSIAVTLVERNPQYVSNIMSSLVLTGQRTMASLNYRYDTLRRVHGVQVVTDEVLGIDPATPSVRLRNGGTLVADRLVLAPGIDFEPPAGRYDANAMPHAWQAGPQTALLASQLAAMRPGGTLVLTIPKAPYRCPPGPYERACLLADWMKAVKPGSKLLVLDANPDFVTEADNFGQAFFGLHASVIEYRTGVVIDSVDAATLTLQTNGGAVRGDVVNLIPLHRAPALLRDAGLATANGGRFAPVEVLGYASTLAPRVHVLGDANSTTQPKSGHLANQSAKVCADAIVRALSGGAPDPAPVTSTACFSTITRTQASWLTALFQYDPATRTMVAVPEASQASAGWNGDHFEDMNTWFESLMSDSFA